MLERSSIIPSMNKLTIEKRAQVIAALVEGNSIRATVRLTGAAKGTVIKLLADVGRVCAEYQSRTLRNLPCRRIQCDEIWSFCYAKEKNVPENLCGQFGFGDVWTWTALCADTKLVPSWMVGKRDAGTAFEFMQDLAGRLASRVQLTTDGNRVYIEAVESAFGSGIDYAMLVKVYGADNAGESRYTPPQCIGTYTTVVAGKPNFNHVSTSFVERQNLTMRMSMRRFTRLTNAFSKKVDNLGHAVALHFMHYNFCRIHQSVRCSPAMAAGVSDRLWEIEDIARLLDSN